MRALVPCLVCLIWIGLFGESALAGGPMHPRRAWAVTGTSERPAVLFSSMRAWVPDGNGVQRVCSERGGCVRVVRLETCSQQRCPPGSLCHLEQSLGNNPAFSRDPHLLWRELESMAQDPVLRPLVEQLMQYFRPLLFPGAQVQREGLPYAANEPPDPPAWVIPKRGPWHYELGFALAQGAWGDMDDDLPDKTWGYLYGGTVRIGFRYQGRVFPKKGGGGIDGCISGLMWALWEIISGNQWGADLQLHAWREGDRTRFGLGIKPVLLAVMDDDATDGTERIRLPASFGLVAPEVGLHFSNRDWDPAMYIRFQAPVSIMLTGHLGLDLRLAWGVQFLGERPGWFGGIDLGLLIR